MSKHSRVSGTGGIRRGPRRADNFTIISNAVINDDRLSFRARGILLWLLSKPVDWRVHSELIAAQSPREGREAVRTAMRELVDLGYLVREKVQDDAGRWATIQTVYEEPVCSGGPSPRPGKPDPGTPSDGSPGAQTKNGSPRTETHRRRVVDGTHDRARETTPAAAADDSAAPRKIAGLEAAVRAVELSASFRKLTDEQRAEIAALIDAHGVPSLVKAAQRQHRPDNPARFVQAWLPVWRDLLSPKKPPVGSVRSARDVCTLCDEAGWLLGPDRLPVEPVRRCDHGTPMAA